MRHALGRILWIVPSLALVSVLALLILVAANASGAGLRGDPFAERRLRELPLLLNPNPSDVRSLAAAAARSVAYQEPDAALAAGTLVRLGGAALPQVVPALETLPVPARARVALALLPVARRMHLDGGEEVRDADDALLFWQRFWEDRGLDFRTAVVRRAVRRAALETSATRREELRELDTFALPELIDALGAVHSPEDVARVARLTELIAPLAPACPIVEPHGSLTDARAATARCRRWWSATGTDYIELDGPTRVAAMIGETQYGKWLGDAIGFGLGTTTEGASVLGELARRGPFTLLLLAAGLLGGALGAVLGTFAGVRRRGMLELLSTPLAIAVAAVPGAVLATWLASSSATAPRAVGALVAMVLPGLALVSRHQRALARRALREEPARTLLAFGAGSLALGRAHLRTSSTAAAALLGSDLPLLLTTSFVVERAFRLEGLGAATVAAIEHRDLAWLMGMALLSSLAVGLAQIVSDTLLAALDPRLRVALSLRREGFE